jgi:glycosyltransferase involved in cell wall biosynthesis
MTTREEPTAQQAAGGRPLMSLLLFAYRQEQYVEAALRSALAQTYQPLEIIASDDCSPDSTFAVIERIAAEYRGPHRLRLNRNPVNLGMGAHYQKVLGMAHGRYLVLAAGDDLSAPDRVAEVAALAATDPEPGIVYSDMTVIDPAGNEVGPYLHYYSQADINRLDSFVWGDATIFGASFSISREIYDRFDTIMAWNEIEDRTLIFRAHLLGKRIVHLPKPLVQWRTSGRSSNSQRRYANRNKVRLQYWLANRDANRWLYTSYRQNLLDLWSLGADDPALERGLLTRIAEAKLAHDLWAADEAEWSRLLAAWRAGARLPKSLKLFLKFRYVDAYMALLKPWRRLRGQTAPSNLEPAE